MTLSRFGLIAAVIALAIYAAVEIFDIDLWQIFATIGAYLSVMGTL